MWPENDASTTEADMWEWLWKRFVEGAIPDKLHLLKVFIYQLMHNRVALKEY